MCCDSWARLLKRLHLCEQSRICLMKHPRLFSRSFHTRLVEGGRSLCCYSSQSVATDVNHRSNQEKGLASLEKADQALFLCELRLLVLVFLLRCPSDCPLLTLLRYYSSQLRYDVFLFPVRNLIPQCLQSLEIRVTAHFVTL